MNRTVPEIRAAKTKADWAEVQRLCWDYRDFLLSIPEPDRSAVTNAYPVDIYRALMDDLPRLHAPPTGGALLVWQGDTAVGCGMFYEFAPEVAEIKRVYFDDAARGTGLGRRVMTQLIQDCYTSGYRKIYLDTGRLLTSAIALYQRLGFTPRGPYQSVPPEIEPLLRFFEKDLT